ncbi:hypothetical protein BKK54_08975 [Rodentibacter genomosp. 1]|uniref:Transferrin-binding protein B C-lobe/N-lobe beta barrel domain-containing protein n=1 Tax=Rodentibacter genomosp. 1 TaxID=1908264 RepID=A0A1V3J3M1_9PAST|nr:hypothetical protein [Rodentibacter genomosp. 1]OOF49418.1 hypothetical protein BKK54_08975 [Rodentibacter genomosp. 1]
MNVTMKKTAAAAIVALMLSGCKIFGSSGSHTPQPIEPVPTVKAIDYSKQSVQQLEQSATTAQKVLSDSQTKLTQVETQITEINRRITTLNQEISVLEKAEKPDANALKEKRDALAEANQALTVQNKILVVAQQDVKQAQINVTNVQNILIEKKAEQNKPPVVVVPDNPSQPSQPTQPEQPTEPEQPSQPTQQEQPSEPEQPSKPTQPEQPSEPEQPSQPTQQEQPSEPEQPSKPTQPEQPTKPVQPSEPTQPEKPTIKPEPQPEPEKTSINLEGEEWRKGARYDYSKRFHSYRYGYVKGYDGPEGELVLSRQNNPYFEGLNFDYLARTDEKNPDFYGWHEGYFENEGIIGIEIKELDKDGYITKAVRPEKFNLIFKNTPYSTYGALYTNEHDVKLFMLTGSNAALGERSDAYSVGKFRVNDKGVKTDYIDYIDEVKGSATYKGEVLARTDSVYVSGYINQNYSPTKPFKDGDITINAHFGSRPEENFTTATLNSKTLGKREFGKSRMELTSGSIQFKNEGNLLERERELILQGRFVGEKASEAVGQIRYEGRQINRTNNNQSYEAVFSAEKQPK